MDIVITFWDKLNSKVEVRYLTSIFLGHSRADLKTFYMKKVYAKYFQRDDFRHAL